MEETIRGSEEGNERVREGDGSERQREKVKNRMSEKEEGNESLKSVRC